MSRHVLVLVSVSESAIGSDLKPPQVNEKMVPTKATLLSLLILYLTKNS